MSGGYRSVVNCPVVNCPCSSHTQRIGPATFIYRVHICQFSVCSICSMALTQNECVFGRKPPLTVNHSPRMCIQLCAVVGSMEFNYGKCVLICFLRFLSVTVDYGKCILICIQTDS